MVIFHWIHIEGHTRSHDVLFGNVMGCRQSYCHRFVNSFNNKRVWKIHALLIFLPRSRLCLLKRQQYQMELFFIANRYYKLAFFHDSLCHTFNCVGNRSHVSARKPKILSLRNYFLKIFLKSSVQQSGIILSYLSKQNSKYTQAQKVLKYVYLFNNKTTAKNFEAKEVSNVKSSNGLVWFKQKVKNR